MLEIEKGIPVPKTRFRPTPAPGKWPVGLMEEGDSFLVPGVPQSRVSSLVAPVAARHGFRIVTRQEKRGVRVWMVASPLKEALALLSLATFPDPQTGERAKALLSE